ncbi:hypothetical protein [Streptomyces gardneri]|uniref:Uncharacterized protein n=1 Tax=Streptomyces gardneri TaxID=66892 RepID=A0A4Y3RJT2_9ACTN|nr:hypothetical protein [Streptomyces gardneri]GEB57198.1 hypothetical protein SGA01_28030 [Streptomyces gardneri]GHH22455.1 hypothetical protein GCM10017674_78220 [Streptomyces gardneri]
MAEVGGWIWERNLRSFLELLSFYVGYGFDATDWETVALAVEATDDERPDGWYSYPLAGEHRQVEVRLARAVGGDELLVAVKGTLTPELEVRADTLLAAFAAG